MLCILVDVGGVDIAKHIAGSAFKSYRLECKIDLRDAIVNCIDGRVL